jgi:hypothetical protein
MSAVVLILAIVAMASLGFLAIFVVLLIGTRSESSRLSPSSASHTRAESVARRILGLYVRREMEKPTEYDVRR